MLDLAQRLLRQHPRHAARRRSGAGVPIVGLEPSCVAAFRDELLNLFPHDEHARRLRRQTFMLERVPRAHAPDWEPPKLRRQARSCTATATTRPSWASTPRSSCWSGSGSTSSVPDSGCCGMAGAFGFERENYDVSVAVGERVLLPAVRDRDDDTLVVADGFSCREQIVSRPAGGAAPRRGRCSSPCTKARPRGAANGKRGAG